MNIFDGCPSPPDWLVPWDKMRSSFPWVDELHACPQDPIFHAEGDVGIHTQMACEALASSPVFRQLPATERQIVFAAVLLHDVAKPACTKHEDGRITSRGHSGRGENMARKMLWRQGVPFTTREAICGLIRYHQVPFFLVDRQDCQRYLYRVSQVARCDHLALVAWADGYGRRCAKDRDQQRILENAELFRDYATEHDCVHAPRAFATDHSRFLYFQKEDRDPNYRAHDDTRCEVTLMSGLPASGKSHWIEKSAGNLPLVSLDDLRAELGVAPDAPQRRVVDEARERAKALLRKNQSFVWNATNVSRQIRESLISLFSNYHARVRVVYLEAPEPTLRKRNNERENPVPDSVIDRLLDRWTVPSPDEAQRIVVMTHESGL